MYRSVNCPRFIFTARVTIYSISSSALYVCLRQFLENLNPGSIVSLWFFMWKT
uniref:Uncharacterized protein n=1 Tax=Anguilla anguilla TaxID=7936 RepID=A0A0E9RIV1_ANGAN